jgi:hypothetical protein
VPPISAGGRDSRGRTLTQTRPSATATSCGLAPTGIVTVTRPLAGSIRETVPSPVFATQTPPAPTAMPSGRRPTGIVRRTVPVRASMRATASSSESVTHAAPAPSAMSTGPPATGIGLLVPVRGSIRLTTAAGPSATHTAVPFEATTRGACPSSILGRWTVPVCGSSRVSRPLAGATHSEDRSSATAALPSAKLWTRIGCPAVSKRASILCALTNGLVRVAPATQTTPSPAASPAGRSPIAIVLPPRTGRVSIRVTE